MALDRKEDNGTQRAKRDGVYEGRELKQGGLLEVNTFTCG
jgi:hypothetical protein